MAVPFSAAVNLTNGLLDVRKPWHGVCTPGFNPSTNVDLMWFER